MDQATTAGWVGTSGSIGCLLIELYDDYDSGERTPPASVSGQSIDHLLWTPFRVYNDLAFTNTVPIPVAADAPGQVFMSSGSWTFYGIPEAGSLGGSCLRSPDSAFWEETRLETAVIGPGSVSFRWRAAADGYLGGIEFRVDGSRISRLVGTTDWIEVNVTIAEGRHSIAWASNRWDEGPTNTLDDFYFLDAIRVSSADDMLEENDEASRASALADGGHGLVCADADWFALQLNKGDGFRLELTTSAHTGRLQFFLRTPGGGEREAENMGSMQVLEMRDAFDYIRVLVCVRPTGMEIGAYSLHVAYDRVVDKGALSTLRIEGGAAIDTEENARFSGTATISWENAWATAADLLLICSWGDHSQSYSIYAGAVAPGNSSGSIEFADIQAPACAGTYWMFLVYRGGVTPEQLASSSFDNGGVVDWNDGDDIAGQGADAVPGIRSEGRIWLRCLGANGAVYRMPVPCAVLQVSVADITPPVTSVTIRGEVGDGLWYRSLVEITLAAQDPSGVQKIMYRIDDGGWQTYAGPFRIAEDGSHRIACSATDGLDHVEEASSFPFFIDQAPPQLACTVAGKTGENGWHTGPVSLTPLFGDETSGCRARYRIDGGPWMELSGAVLLEIPGWHRVDMSCLDGAGNAASLSQEVGIDLAGPRTTVTLDGERLGAQWFGSAVRAAIAALDLDSGAASTMVRLDGGEWLRVDGTFLIAEAGQHVLECLAIDAAGNLGETAAVRVAIDLLPPLVTFCGRPDGVSLIALDTPEVVLNGTDDVGGLSFFIRVDEGGWQSLRGGMTRITAGQHHVQAYATDAAGRIGPISSTILVYDPEDPTAVLTVDGRAGELGWYLGPVRLSVNASDAQPGRVTASLQVNGRAVDPAGFLLDSPGWHDIVYMARDLAGNTFGPVAVHLGVDLQAPLLICERSGTRGANGWYVGEVRLNITVLEDASGVQLLEYSLDGGGWERADGGVIVRHDGIHTVQLRCRDRAGNAATLSMEVPIDAGGPLIPYSEGEELHLKDRSLALRFKMGDWCSGLSSVKVSVDKGEPMLLDVATPTLMLEQLSDGRHLLEIEARDCAGNIASRTVTIDMNTDPLDPEGPYGILPLAAIVCLLAIAVAMIIRWGCRYR
jgi:hypothetical protein